MAQIAPFSLVCDKCIFVLTFSKPDAVLLNISIFVDY